MNFFDDYDLEFSFKLGRRAGTFRSVFSKLRQVKPNNITVVETGMINDPGNWLGHGQSTVIFDALVKAQGGKVFSVDINPEALIATRKLVSDQVVLAYGNSINFLSSLEQPIDLLYLDSFDLDVADPSPSARHHMCELTAAFRNLHPGSIICIDDTVWNEKEPPFGKGMLVCDYMKHVNAERITAQEGLQVAWILK